MSEPEKRSFLFVLGSSRPGGNTETLARAAAEHLPANVPQRWITLRDLPLDPYRDHRHPRGYEYPEPTGHRRTLLEATVEATDIVIASPIYWYTVSTETKLYLDHWTDWLHMPEVAFRDRMSGGTLWGVTVSSHGEEEDEIAEPLIGTLRLTARYMRMKWGGALLGHGNRPGQIEEDAAALVRAKTFFGF